MVFGSVAAHDENAITIFDVNPVIGHCSTPERLSQSRNRRAVSDTGLVVQIDDSQGSSHGIQRPALLIIDVGASKMCYSFSPIYQLALRVFLDKSFVSCGFDPLCDLADCPIPRFLLPFVAAWSPVERLP